VIPYAQHVMWPAAGTSRNPPNCSPAGCDRRNWQSTLEPLHGATRQTPGEIAGLLSITVEWEERMLQITKLRGDGVRICSGAILNWNHR